MQVFSAYFFGYFAASFRIMTRSSMFFFLILSGTDTSTCTIVEKRPRVFLVAWCQRRGLQYCWAFWVDVLASFLTVSIVSTVEPSVTDPPKSRQPLYNYKGHGSD